MEDAEASQPSLGGPSPPPPLWNPRMCDLLSRVWEKIFSWYVLKTLLMGQLLSLFICGTAVTSQYLAETYKVDTPMLQSFINYCLLFMVYTVWLAFRSGENGILYIVRHKWWKYLLLGIVDVEANYCIVKAYQFTTLTSVQLLDCVGIPVLMTLSWFILHSRYKLIHYIAVVVCLLGVGTMVGADFVSGRESNKATDMLIGDALVILAACLYAVSNVTEEYVVKNLTREEFLGMLGLFGTFVSGTQLSLKSISLVGAMQVLCRLSVYPSACTSYSMIVEYNAIGNIQWNWQVGLLFAGFAICMFCLYSVMPLVMKVSSATSVNLGILTADIYSLFFGLFLFGYTFSVLYILAFVVCIVGFIMYCSTSSFSAEPPPERTNEGVENSGMKQEEASLESVTPLHHLPDVLSIDRRD